MTETKMKKNNKSPVKTLTTSQRLRNPKLGRGGRGGRSLVPHGRGGRGSDPINPPNNKQQVKHKTTINLKASIFVF